MTLGNGLKKATKCRKPGTGKKEAQGYQVPESRHWYVVTSLLKPGAEARHGLESLNPAPEARRWVYLGPLVVPESRDM